ncbi:hypothetical protein O0L34_g5758 [Tuta absoluta]|nr:hypothetical protein O0L34_g5758 [Tuta absoluta]
MLEGQAMKKSGAGRRMKLNYVAQKELTAKAAVQANAIEANILKNNKIKQRRNKNVDELNDNNPVHSMTGDYYFIQSCCMLETPKTRACQNSVDRFNMVCKQKIGTSSETCKKKANQLYKKSCKADPIFNGWPLFPTDQRRHRLSRSMRENMLHPVSKNVPLEVPKGAHRVLW